MEFSYNMDRIIGGGFKAKNPEGEVVAENEYGKH